MKVPNLIQAEVAEAKITKYLLNDSHPHGKDKAVLFVSFGFSLSNWQLLEQALLHHVRDNEVISTLATDQGTHYVVEGPLVTPDSRNPMMRTIWAIDTDSDIPRFITAYPLKIGKDETNDS